MMRSNDEDLFDIEIDINDPNLDDLTPKKSPQKMKMMNKSLKNPEEIFSASNIFFNSKHESKDFKDVSGDNSEVQEFINNLLNGEDDNNFTRFLNQIE